MQAHLALNTTLSSIQSAQLCFSRLASQTMGPHAQAEKCKNCIETGKAMGMVPELNGMLWCQCRNWECRAVWLVCSVCDTRTQFSCDIEFDVAKKRQLREHMRKHNFADQFPVRLSPPPTLVDQGQNRAVKRMKTVDAAAECDDFQEDEMPAVSVLPYELGDEEDQDFAAKSDDVGAKLAEIEDMLQAKMAKMAGVVAEFPLRTDNQQRIAIRNASVALPQSLAITREASHRFIMDQRLGRRAAANLVMRCIHQNDWKMAEEMSPKDVASFFAFAKFVWSLPTKARYSLAHVVRLFQDGDQGKFSFLPLQIDGANSLRKLVWEGKHAFASLLPHPRAIVIQPDDVVYIFPIESIAHILAMENCLPFDTVAEPAPGKARLLSENAYAQARRDPSADFHFCMMTWSDGFQANYSTKVNRLKPWIKTATIAAHGAFKMGDWGDHLWKSTFPVAFGSENNSKEGIERRFYSEMKLLDAPGGMTFYVARLNRDVKVRVTLVLVRGDQPERRKFCGLVGVNGNYGAAFGVIGNCKEIASSLPSCDNCLSAMTNSRTILKCECCLNWDFLKKGSSLNWYTPGGKFPAEEFTRGDNKLPFRSVTFDLLKEVIVKSHDKIVGGHWGKGQAIAYMEAHALNDEVRKAVYEHAHRAKLWLQAETRKEEFPQEHEMLKEVRDGNPSLFERWIPPALWESGVEMTQVVCIIMHLLFLGVAKQMLELGGKWSSSFNLGSVLEKAAHGVLESVQSLGLPWCKALPYKKGTGGSWVSENYLAFAKLMPWFYSMLDEIDVAPKPAEVESLWPVCNLNNDRCWSGSICEKWLRHRNLDASGKAEEKQRRVRKIMESGDIPKLLEKGPTDRQVMAVMQTCHAMICSLMATTVGEEEIAEADCRVRIFLTLFSKIDRQMDSGKSEKAKETPEWIRHANFLSLPRVVEAMKEFGPPRLGWEGGVVGGGEGVLRNIKPELKSGMSSQNWHKNCVDTILKAMAIHGIAMSSEILTNISGNLWEHRDRAKEHPGYRQHSHDSEVRVLFRSNKPISGFLGTDGKFWVCVKKGRERVKFQISVLHGEGIAAKCGITYTKWELQTGNEEHLLPADVDRPVMFLPQLCGDGLFLGSRDPSRGWHCVMDDEWKYWDAHINQFLWLTPATWPENSE